MIAKIYICDGEREEIKKVSTRRAKKVRREKRKMRRKKYHSFLFEQSHSFVSYHPFPPQGPNSRVGEALHHPTPLPWSLRWHWLLQLPICGRAGTRPRLLAPSLGSCSKRSSPAVAVAHCHRPEDPTPPKCHRVAGKPFFWI